MKSQCLTLVHAYKYTENSSSESETVNPLTLSLEEGTGHPLT